jgi:3-methyladenine DNA glycosylase AlkD
MKVQEVIKLLESHAEPGHAKNMEHFAITPKKAFGIPTPKLHGLAKEIKKKAADRHKLALELWKTENYDARCFAALIDDPKQVTEAQMDAWVKDFDNWGICDCCCCYLFDKTPFVYKKISEWAAREEEFVRRAAFALVAYLTVHDKKADDRVIEKFLPLVEKHSDDDRNFVKKAVNWSLRQIGKRSLNLRKKAVETAERIKNRNTKAARWIAADALRELQDPETMEGLTAKESRRKLRNEVL